MMTVREMGVDMNGGGKGEGEGGKNVKVIFWYIAALDDADASVSSMWRRRRRRLISEPSFSRTMKRWRS